MLKYRPYFLALGLIFMLAGVGLALRRSRQVCDVAQHRRNLWLFPSVALLSFGISYGLLTYVTPALVYRSPTPAASAGQPTRVADAAPQAADAPGVAAPEGVRDAVAGNARSQPAVAAPAIEVVPSTVAPQEPEAPASVPAARRRATLAIQGMT
jgi:hypothetical protein